MTMTTLEVRTPDGVADAHAFTPDDGKGPWPAIVMYVDAFGVRPTMDAMAQRLASSGYFVLLPNVFYRSGEFAPFDVKTAFSDPQEKARLMAILGSLDENTTARDAAAFADALTRDPRVRGTAIGFVGYCLGGRLAFVSAAQLGDRAFAAASIHGGGLATDKPNSPHKSAGKVRAALYFGVADNDGSCTLEQQKELRAALDAAHVSYELELYSGARHGFAVPDHSVYDQAAAERHWERITAFFAANAPRG